MNQLILNRDTFQLPSDGWYQIAPIGEFPHASAGVVQVVDRAACEAMADAFRAESASPNFAGLLIDFDHFSLDGKQKSEAAGWITALKNRENGLWANIRWSDLGEDCVKGGRYRFISPVWARADCEDLGADLQSGRQRVRPVRLLNAAVTNDPNLKGMVPLSNRAEMGKAESRNEDAYNTEGVPANDANCREYLILNSSPAPVRLKWVFGDSPEGRHCPSCSALAGQVHSAADWETAGIRPGAGMLYCQGYCHCQLVETDEPESGELAGVSKREDVANREIANSWSDAARAASIAARKAKAAARKMREQKRKGAEREREDKEDGPSKQRIDDVEPPVNGTPETPDDEPMPDEYEYWRHAVEGYRQNAEAIFRETYGYPPKSTDEIREAEEMAGVPPEYRTGGKKSRDDLAKELFKTQQKHEGAGDIQPANRVMTRADALDWSSRAKARARVTNGGVRKRSVDFCSFSRGQTKEKVKAEIAMEGQMDKQVEAPVEGATVEELANVVRFEQEKNKVLMDEVLALEDELANRDLAVFADVVHDETRDFWREQLLHNRQQATVALKQMVEMQAALKAAPEADETNIKPRPMHNRSVVRPVQPGANGGAALVVVDDGKAGQIRNRAHEIRKAEGVPFSVAFRRAEKEVLGAVKSS